MARLDNVDLKKALTNEFVGAFLCYYIDSSRYKSLFVGFLLVVVIPLQIVQGVLATRG